MSKELEDKLNEIINYIKESDSYKNYLKSKELLEKRSDLKEKIIKIKKYQQELVKDSSNKEIKLKLDECIKYLNNDPTYLEYINYLSDVNNLIGIFENKINYYFDNLLN